MQPIGPNPSPIGAINAVNKVKDERGGVFERLSTGLRINRASDDPAGLISSEQLRSVLSALEAETRAVERTDAVLNVADSALASASGSLNDARAAAVAAANTGALSDAERAAYQTQYTDAVNAANRAIDDAEFNEQALFDGEITARAGESELNLSRPSTDELSAADLAADPSAAAEALDAVAARLASARGEIGSFQSNALGSRAESIRDESLAVASSLSEIRDTDYARETAELARTQILEQTNQTALALSLASASQVLRLL
ncbi:MAG: flagellin [Planctomycetota bacterium]